MVLKRFPVQTSKMNILKIRNYSKQAQVISELSPDLETKVGALLINSTTGAVLSSGYNGFIRGAPDKTLPKVRPDKYNYIVHAEANLIYNCARHGISMSDCYVYCTLSPCINCLRALYQSGVTTVIFKEKYRDFDEQSKMLDLNWDLIQHEEFTEIKIK